MRNLLEKGYIVLTSCREYVRRKIGMNQSATSVTNEKLPCFAQATAAVDRDGQKWCIPCAEGVDKENRRRWLHQGKTGNVWKKARGMSSALKETAS
jgi:hypothetical protein